MSIHAKLWWTAVAFDVLQFPIWTVLALRDGGLYWAIVTLNVVGFFFHLATAKRAVPAEG